MWLQSCPGNENHFLNIYIFLTLLLMANKLSASEAILPEDAQRIAAQKQSEEAKEHGGVTQKGSEATREKSAADQHSSSAAKEFETREIMQGLRDPPKSAIEKHEPKSS